MSTASCQYILLTCCIPERLTSCIPQSVRCCILQKCPVCNQSTRDMLQHLMMHQRAADEYLCSSPSSQASSSVSRSMSSVSTIMFQFARHANTQCIVDGIAVCQFILSSFTAIGYALIASDNAAPQILCTLCIGFSRSGHEQPGRRRTC